MLLLSLKYRFIATILFLYLIKFYNMKFLYYLVLFVVMITLFGLKKGTKNNSFSCLKTNEPVSIDGKMDEAIWGATEVRSLDYFYKHNKKYDAPNSTLRMLWDKDNLYAFFEVKDAYLNAKELKRDGRPYLDDCVELFISPTPNASNVHLGFEINLLKVINDFVYINKFYEGKRGLVSSFNPNIKMEVFVNGTINNNTDLDKGWNLELSIPLRLFYGLDKFQPIKAGNRWNFLAVHKDQNNPGNPPATATIFPILNVETVHDSEQFGGLEFVE